MRVNGVFRIDALGNLDDALRLIGHVLGLMVIARDDHIADLEARDLRANAAHEAVIAVTHPARKIRSARHLLGPFVIPAVGSDF